MDDEEVVEEEGYFLDMWVCGWLHGNGGTIKISSFIRRFTAAK